MVWSDGFHTGLEDRSIIVRFEDLHTDLVATMSRVAKWLGLADSPVLFESTFNGQPWVVASGGNSWTGARPQQARRRARNMFWVDRAVLFALFHVNFVAWGYDYPRFLAHRSLRALCLMLVLGAPMRLELASDVAVLRTMLLPAMRTGNFRLAAQTLWRALIARAAMRALIFRELWRRLAAPKKLASPIQGRAEQPSGSSNRA